MRNEIEKIDEYLVWPDALYQSKNDDIQYLQDLSTAEIGVYNIAFDEERRKALFSYDPNKEFIVEFEEYTCHVNLDWYIQIYTNQISKQQNPSPNAPVYCYSYSKSLFCNCSPRWDGSIPAYLTSLPKNIIRSSKFGLFFPMLYLMALRFSVLEGKRYSIEMVAEELFANKLVTRPDFLSSMKFSGEWWTKTILPSVRIGESDFSGDDIHSSEHPNRANMMFFTRLEDAASNTVIYMPVCSAKLKDNPKPIPFYGVSAAGLYPVNCETMRDEKPILVTDFFDLAAHNSVNKRITVISWIGGKAAIDKTNFSALVGKSMIYLVRKADNEKTAKRAAETAIAFFRKMKSTGFCHISFYDYEHKDLIDQENLCELCRRYDVTLPEELDSVVNVKLPWSGKDMHIGEKIIGTIFERGRLILIHAEYGIGKTLLSMIFANIASRGKSLDDSILKFNGTPSKVLYVQQEMQEGNGTCDDMAKRQQRIDKLFGGSPFPEGAITYFKPTGDLTRVEEQIAVNRKLMELNPNGDIPFMLILDNVKSIMPAAVTQAGYNKIKPWLDGLKESGITTLLIHHDGKEGESYGTIGVLDHADSVLHLTRHDLKRRELIAKLPKKISQEWTDKFDMEDAAQLLEEMNTPNRRVYCAIDKDRHASTGLECKPFHIDWVINEKEQWMKAEYNDYSSIERGIKAALRRFQSTLTTVGENKDAEGFDDSSDAGFSIDTVIESYRESEESSEASEAETEEKEVFSSGASVVELPSSLAALNGLPEDRQRAALLELRARYGSVKSVAQKLNCSESLLEKRCKKLGVTKEAVQKYAAGLTK